VINSRIFYFFRLQFKFQTSDDYLFCINLYLKKLLQWLEIAAFSIKIWFLLLSAKPSTWFCVGLWSTLNLQDEHWQDFEFLYIQMLWHCKLLESLDVLQIAMIIIIGNKLLWVPFHCYALNDIIMNILIESCVDLCWPLSNKMEVLVVLNDYSILLL
jgi:hypothetical protein